MAAQQRSHGMEEADESFTLQMAVESTIHDEFPDEFEGQFRSGSSRTRRATTRAGS